MMIFALVTGLGVSAIFLAAVFWSICFPERRVWPPKRSTHLGKAVLWTITVTLFASAIYLGIRDWNHFGWPALPRWLAGLPLIVIGNVVVWRGVGELGFEATSGEVGALRIDGLYRYSRNPQYVADMAIALGWMILSASLWAAPVALAGIVVLAVTPFAEEPWLEDAYGENYRAYRKSVRRYI